MPNAQTPSGEELSPVVPLVTSWDLILYYVYLSEHNVDIGSQSHIYEPCFRNDEASDMVSVL